METDEARGEFEESLVDVLATVVAHSEASKGMKPTDRPFDDPAIHAQSAAVFAAALGQMRLDSQPPQQLSGRLAIIGAISIDFFRPRTRMARLAAHRRDVDQQWDQFRNVRRAEERVLAKLAPWSELAP